MADHRSITLQENYKIFSVIPKRSLKTQIIEKQGFPVKKNFGLVFLVLSSRIDVGKQIIRNHKLL